MTSTFGLIQDHWLRHALKHLYIDLISSCHITFFKYTTMELFVDNFFPFRNHYSLSQMSSFQSDANIEGDLKRVKTPTYLLARDEDCENSFHSTADFVSKIY